MSKPLCKRCPVGGKHIARFCPLDRLGNAHRVIMNVEVNAGIRLTFYELAEFPMSHCSERSGC